MEIIIRTGSTKSTKSLIDAVETTCAKLSNFPILEKFNLSTKDVDKEVVNVVEINSLNDLKEILEGVDRFTAIDIDKGYIGLFIESNE